MLLGTIYNGGLMTLESLQQLAVQRGDLFPRRDFGRGALAYRLALSLEDCPPECDSREFERGYQAQAADFYLD